MRSRPVALSTLALTALLAACGGAEPTASLGVARQATLTVEPGSNTLVAGLGGPAGYGEIDLKANTSAFTAPVTAFAGTLDDGVWTVDLSSLFPDGIVFGGQNFKPATVYVGTNGYVTFGQAAQLTSLDKVQNAPAPLIAAFLADADLTASGNLYVHVDTSAADPVATVTWLDVPPFVPSGGAAPTTKNSFQLRLHRVSTDAAAGDKVAVELRYAKLEWKAASTMVDVQTAATLYAVGGWSAWSATGGLVRANLFPDKAYTTTAYPESASYNYGTRFTTTQAGKILGIRYYADPSESGDIPVGLYSGDTAATATLLGQAHATLTAGTAGWQTLLFSTPLDVSPGTTYTAVAVLPGSNQVRIGGYFDAARDSGPLQMPVGAGVWEAGPTLTYPTQAPLSFPNAAYLVDALFEAGAPSSAYGEILGSGSSDVDKNATAEATATNVAQPGVYVFGGEGVPAALTVSSDASPQSATVSAAFARPLALTVKDAYGHPVQGVTVTFAAPSSGAGAALSAATAVTDAQGVASVTATANGTAGTYTVVATAGSATGSFQLTNADSSGGSGPKSSGGCGTGGDASAGLFLPALSALVLRLRRRR